VTDLAGLFGANLMDSRAGGCEVAGSCWVTGDCDVAALVVESD
jgi:hypothetical protein